MTAFHRTREPWPKRYGGSESLGISHPSCVINTFPDDNISGNSPRRATRRHRLNHFLHLRVSVCVACVIIWELRRPQVHVRIWLITRTMNLGLPRMRSGFRINLLEPPSQSTAGRGTHTEEMCVLTILEAKIKVLAGLVSSEASLLGWQTAAFFLCLQVAFPLCFVCTLISFSRRALVRVN